MLALNFAQEQVQVYGADFRQGRCMKNIILMIIKAELLSVLKTKTNGKCCVFIFSKNIKFGL